MKPRSPKKASLKFLYTLHAWLGFHLAVLMALVLLTGTLAVIANEIDWLFQDDMRVTRGAATEKVSWGQLQAAARAYRPDDTLVSLSALKGDYFAYRARMRDVYGRPYFLHLNPWNGDVTGITRPLTVQRFFRDLHRYLFLPKVIGLPLVTSLAFVLAISLYTGLKTTRKWRRAATQLRTDRGARVAVSDAHKAGGLWSSWLMVIIILTSLWYLAEFIGQLSRQPFEPMRPGLSDARTASLGPVIPDVDADTLVAAATAAFPELQSRVIYFAGRANQAVTVQGRAGSFLVRDRANRVFLDPVDASVIHVQRSQDIGWVAFLNEIADPLHFGYFGGLVTKLMWFVFALMLTGLSISGVWLMWKRLRTRAPSRTQWATLPILVVSMIFGVFWFQRIVGPFVPAAERHLPADTRASLQQSAHIALDRNQQPTGRVRALVRAAQGRPHVVEVSVTLLPANSTVTTRVRTLGQSVPVYVDFTPEQLADAREIQLRSEFVQGASWLSHWVLMREPPDS